MGSEGRIFELDWLGRELLMVLLNGTETTLLLLQTVNYPEVHPVKTRPTGSVSEEQLLDSLNDLEVRTLVKSRKEKTWAGASGGIPECEVGRSHMVWWDLTKEGRVLANRVAEASRNEPKQEHCPSCEQALNFAPWNGSSASDEICPHCGIQFGYNDANSQFRQDVYERWRVEWMANGCKPFQGEHWHEVSHRVANALTEE